MQELCCDTRSWTEPEGHRRALVTDAFEPKSEEQAVRLCDQQMHVEVGHVDLPHVLSPAELGLKGVQALHLEVLVLEVRIDRRQVDAPRILSVPFFGTGKKTDLTRRLSD